MPNFLENLKNLAARSGMNANQVRKMTAPEILRAAAALAVVVVTSITTSLLTVSGRMDLAHQEAAPDAPAEGFVSVYAKDDDKLYRKTSADAEGEIVTTDQAQTFTETQTFDPAATRAKVVVSHEGSLRMQAGVLDSSPTFGTVWLGGITPSDTNFALAADTSILSVQGASELQLRTANAYRARINQRGVAIGDTALSTGANVLMLKSGTAWTPIADAAGIWSADIDATNCAVVLQGERSQARFTTGFLPGSTSHQGVWIGDGAPTATNYVLASNTHASGVHISAFLNTGGNSGNRIYYRHGATTIGAMGLQGWAVTRSNADPATGQNVLMYQAGTHWTPEADASAAYSADFAAGDNRLRIVSEKTTSDAASAMIGNGCVFTGTGDIPYTSSHQTGTEGLVLGHYDAGNYGYLVTRTAGSSHQPFYISCSNFGIVQGGLGTYQFTRTGTGWYLEGTNNAIILSGSVTDGYNGGLRLKANYNADSSLTVTRHNYLELANPVLGGTGPAAVTDACAMRFDAAAGTHKATAAGGATTSIGTTAGWIKVNFNGTVVYVPAYSTTNP